MTVPDASSPPVPTSPTVYAIGDIHGRADLLERLYAALKADAEGLGDGSPPTLVFLGDYIDRGPESARVIDFVLAIRPSEFQVTPLLGNHESAMLGFLEDPRWGDDWSRHGGRETLLAYGLNPPVEGGSWEEVADALEVAVPMEHLSFLHSLRHSFETERYFFCHAGINPHRALRDQDIDDLLWIREPFLSHDRPLEKVIVHGHTITEGVHSDAVRIGLDTGAYQTGRLSAVRLDGTSRRIFFTATADDVTVRVEDHPSYEPATGGLRRSDAIARQLEKIDHHIRRLAALPWPEGGHAQALGTLRGIEAQLADLTDPGGCAPDPRQPDVDAAAAPPPETQAISEWLKDLGVSLAILLGPRISAPALQAARTGDLGAALSLTESLVPASIRRAAHALRSSPEMSAAVDDFLAGLPPSRAAGVLSDDLLRLLLFLYAVRARG